VAASDVRALAVDHQLRPGVVVAHDPPHTDRINRDTAHILDDLQRRLG